MKRVLTILLLLIPFLTFAKFYNAKLIYENGKTENVELRLPIVVTAKKLTVKKNGKTKTIKAEQLSYIDIILNEDSEHYYLKRGYFTQFKNNGEYKSQRKARWSLIQDFYDNIVVSAVGFKYSVSKSRKTKKEKLIITYNEYSQGYYLSKPKENLLVSIEPNMGVTLKKMVERAQGYLFPECPNFSEKIKREEIKRGEHIEQIVAMYQECSK